MKKEKAKSEFLELFGKVEINIPLLDVIKTTPTYAKFLKDLYTNKMKFEEHEKVFLSEKVSAILQRKLPPKLKGPDSFTVSCKIGERDFEKAILNLGASHTMFTNLLVLVRFSLSQFLYNWWIEVWCILEEWCRRCFDGEGFANHSWKSFHGHNWNKNRCQGRVDDYDCF